MVHSESPLKCLVGRGEECRPSNKLLFLTSPERILGNSVHSSPMPTPASNQQHSESLLRKVRRVPHETGHTNRKEINPEICVTTVSMPGEVVGFSWGPFYLLEDTQAGGQIGLLAPHVKPLQPVTSGDLLSNLRILSQHLSLLTEETEHCEMPLFTLILET